MNHEAGGSDEFLVPARGSLCAGRAIPGVCNHRRLFSLLTASEAGILPLLSQCEEPPANAASRAWTSRRVFPYMHFAFKEGNMGKTPQCFFNLTVKRVFSHNLR